MPRTVNNGQGLRAVHRWPGGGLPPSGNIADAVVLNSQSVILNGQYITLTEGP